MDCRNCLHYDVCLLHEDDFISTATKNNFCSKYKDKTNVVTFPCKVGDTVYVIADCDDIPKVLDGTLWGEDGGFGTATGYYCPYEDICDEGDCGGRRVLEMSVRSIYSEYSEHNDVFDWQIGLNNYLAPVGISDFGKTVFHSKTEAERAFVEIEKESADNE